MANLIPSAIKDIIDTSTTEHRLNYSNAVRQEVTPCSSVDVYMSLGGYCW